MKTRAIEGGLFPGRRDGGMWELNSHTCKTHVLSKGTNLPYFSALYCIIINDAVTMPIYAPLLALVER
jgi:hypothetical protein